MRPLGPLPWVGGQHTFFLGLGQIRALQDATGLGPNALYRRLRGGDWLVDDLMEILVQGLVGSDAMDLGDATKLVTGLFRKHPLLEFVGTSTAILAHALSVPEGEDEGKPDPAGEETQTPLDGSSSASSTGTAQS